jgi:hypothetical protein
VAAVQCLLPHVQSLGLIAVALELAQVGRSAHISRDFQHNLPVNAEQIDVPQEQSSAFAALPSVIEQGAGPHINEGWL